MVCFAYQGFLASNGMVDYDFTWSRIHENGTIRRSAIDQCITNSPEVLANPSKVEVGFSDHDAIFVDLKTSKKPKEQASQIVRNMGKLRRNPDKFQQMLANIPVTGIAPPITSSIMLAAVDAISTAIQHHTNQRHHHRHHPD